MKPFLVGVVLAVTLSAPVCAEPLAVPLSVYATAAALDLHSTHRFLQYEGFHETSWMSRLEHRPGTMIAVSALADAGMVYALSRVVDLKVLGGPHPRFKRIELYAAASVRLLYAVDNYKAITATSVRKR